MTFDFDLFVIGGGSGGVRAARIAAGEHGARVALAEESRMGGTCVIRGCVPKKLFVIGSHVHQEIEDAAGFGWNIGQISFDWATLVANKDKVVSRGRLMADVWDENWYGSTKTLDATVGRLRQKLQEADAPVVLGNVRGVGFRLEDAAGHA